MSTTQSQRILFLCQSSDPLFLVVVVTFFVYNDAKLFMTYSPVLDWFTSHLRGHVVFTLSDPADLFMFLYFQSQSAVNNNSGQHL